MFCHTHIYLCRDQSRHVPSQWETSLHCDNVSHWLRPYLDWSLSLMPIYWCMVSYWCLIPDKHLDEYNIGCTSPWYCKDDSTLAPNQWEVVLQSNAISHWLGATLHCIIAWTTFFDDEGRQRCIMMQESINSLKPGWDHYINSLACGKCCKLKGSMIFKPILGTDIFSTYWEIVLS